MGQSDYPTDLLRGETEYSSIPSEWGDQALFAGEMVGVWCFALVWRGAVAMQKGYATIMICGALLYYYFFTPLLRVIKTAAINGRRIMGGIAAPWRLRLAGQQTRSRWIESDSIKPPYQE